MTSWPRRRRTRTSQTGRRRVPLRERRVRRVHHQRRVKQNHQLRNLKRKKARERKRRRRKRKSKSEIQPNDRSISSLIIDMFVSWLSPLFWQIRYCVSV
ncbi:hypothetical protein GCK32_020728 [Trichostrongylus colubriformis]|uniref:Uncharacterized protein n=1 Tax=Trichostrongylus colubriformis TaxID=6319 RepID=A0AAN8EYX1_TRICO